MVSRGYEKVKYVYQYEKIGKYDHVTYYTSTSNASVDCRCIKIHGSGDRPS